MANNGNEKLVRTLIDSFNNRDFDKILSLVSDNAEWRDMPSGSVFRGKEGSRQYDQNWLTGFPDSKIEIQNLAVAGDVAVIEFVGRGTHTGQFRASIGQINPTGRRLEMNFCEVIRFQNGQVVSRHTYYDLMSLMLQLGIIEQRRAA